MDTKFKINGLLVSEAHARLHFINSETYRNASRFTRDRIFDVAVYGDRSGNHNPNGEIEHLEEAGITLC